MKPMDGTQPDRKNNIVFETVADGAIAGGISTLVGKFIHLESQLMKGEKLSKGFIKFNEEAHNKWTGGMAIAGAAAGAVYGAMHTSQHNREVDAYTQRVEAQKSAEATAIGQGRA